MSNSFGHTFRITTFGESHGGGLGVIVDGCPAGHPFPHERIAAQLRRRRPGQGRLTSPRQEKDGATIEVVGFSGSVLTLRLGGTLAGDPSAAYVKRGVIEPAIQHAAGRDIEIVYERAPTA